jgi:ABC-2 type transport system ATP-binding protein
MDEAERCGRIGYVYAGKMLTYGTPQELKDNPEVTPPGTRRLEIQLGRGRTAVGHDEAAGGGSDVAELLSRLKSRQGVRQATIFGHAIHALVDSDRGMAELGLDGLAVRPAEPTLEDVFVTLARARGA